MRVSGKKSNFDHFDKLGIFFDNGFKLTNFEDPSKPDYTCSTNINCEAYKSEVSNPEGNINYLFNSGIIVNSSELPENYDYLAAI